MANINEIRQSELTQGEIQVLAEDTKRWQRMGAGAHLDDWLAFGPGLLIRRRLAMRLAYTNEPKGKGYNTAFGQLMEADGLHTMDGHGKADSTKKTAISCVLWLHEDDERLNTLREIRETMTVGERARLNSPISARQRVEKLLAARAGNAEAKKKDSPLARSTRTIAEQTREIEHLREQLAAAEQRSGSLFDLKHDSANDIATVIVNTVSGRKAETVAREVLKQLKAAKPAG
jgi:hypothetical protein